MIERILITSLFAVALFAGSATAGEPARIENAWVRATVPGQQVAGAFMDITSPLPARLVKVESPLGAAEIHSMALRDGVMEMRRVEALELPAGQTVRLAPGGYHIMLIGLKSPLKAGSKVPLALTMENADKTKTTRRIEAIVKDPAGQHRHSR